MNTNDLIKEAAEAMYCSQMGGQFFQPTARQDYINHVTHFLTHAKEKGYELVKVEGDVVGHDEALASGTLKKDLANKDRVIAEWVELVNYIWESSHKVSLNYVHQLQNLVYVVTGNELKIDL